MSKTPKKVLVEAVREELTTYLMQGSHLNRNQLANALDFTGLEINQFDRLKDIHFANSEPVAEFVDRLPQYVQRIRTENRAEISEIQGEIAGRIDWQLTQKFRHSVNYGDRSTFITQTPFRAFDLPENRVLIALLRLLERIVEKELAGVDYEWRESRWPTDRIDNYRRLMKQNLHINRMPDTKRADVSGRDMEAARKSRKPLYYKAYELIRIYERLLADDFQDRDTVQLLESALIAPPSDRLFELFALFMMANSVSSQLSLRPIQRGSDAIVVFQKEPKRVELHHNSQGNLTLNEPIDAERNRGASAFLARQVQARELHQELLDLDSPRSLYRGQPDIIIEEYRTESSNQDSLEKVTVGEVKYTTSKQTASQGALELAEYLTHAQWNGDYILDQPGISIEGVLFTDSMKRFRDTQMVQHQMTSDYL